MLARFYVYFIALVCIVSHIYASLWGSTSTDYRCTEPHEGKTGNECYTISVNTKYPNGSVSTNTTWHGSLPYVNMALKNVKTGVTADTRYCEVQPYNCETQRDCSSDRGVSLPPKDSRYVLEICVEEEKDSGVKSEEVRVYGPMPDEQTCRESVWSSMYRFGLEVLLATVLAWHYSTFENPFIFSFGLNGQR